MEYPEQEVRWQGVRFVAQKITDQQVMSTGECRELTAEDIEKRLHKFNFCIFYGLRIFIIAGFATKKAYSIYSPQTSPVDIETLKVLFNSVHELTIHEHYGCLHEFTALIFRPPGTDQVEDFVKAQRARLGISMGPSATESDEDD